MKYKRNTVSVITVALAVFCIGGEIVFNYMPSFNSGRELLPQGFESDTIKVNSHF
jgi:hypothetical protein